MSIARRPIVLIQLVALFAAVGLAGYLSYLKATNGIPPCQVGGGCAAALYSPWGYLVGVPLAYIGLSSAAVLLTLSLLAGPLVGALRGILLVVGMLFTLYLRYIEQAHFNGHMCAWCVAFMAAWWAAAACEAWRLRQSLRDVDTADEH